MHLHAVTVDLGAMDRIHARPPGRVRIYGWLFFDNWHAADGSVGTWRGSAWEIHPITRIEIWENGAWKLLQ